MRENRKFKREKRRIPCEFRWDGRAHSALVTDLSARGLLVQSAVMPDDGAQIELILYDTTRGEVQVWGRVTRTKTPHRSIANVIPGGFGVAVESASEEFFQIIIELGLA